MTQWAVIFSTHEEVHIVHNPHIIMQGNTILFYDRDASSLNTHMSDVRLPGDDEDLYTGYNHNHFAKSNLKHRLVKEIMWFNQGHDAYTYAAKTIKDAQQEAEKRDAKETKKQIFDAVKKAFTSAAAGNSYVSVSASSSSSSSPMSASSTSSSSSVERKE